MVCAECNLPWPRVRLAGRSSKQAISSSPVPAGPQPFCRSFAAHAAVDQEKLLRSAATDAFDVGTERRLPLRGNRRGAWEDGLDALVAPLLPGPAASVCRGRTEPSRMCFQVGLRSAQSGGEPKESLADCRNTPNAVSPRRWSARRTSGVYTYPRVSCALARDGVRSVGPQRGRHRGSRETLSSQSTFDRARAPWGRTRPRRSYWRTVYREQLCLAGKTDHKHRGLRFSIRTL